MSSNPNPSNTRPNILDYFPQDLEKLLLEKYQIEPYRALQVFQWLYKLVPSFQEMQNLPKVFRDQLTTDFFRGYPEIMKKFVSTDGTEKYLMRWPDNHVVECVRIPYHRGDSVCISTQVGCKMNCTFCASAKGGFIRHLTAGEILGQILTIQYSAQKKITAVSLMGTGEPLDNYDEVVKFMHLAHEPKGLNMSYRHFSLSTSGIVPRIYDLAKLNLPISLCISLHSPFNDQRSEMMPINRKYSIEEIIEAVQVYIKMTHNRVSFEYILINEVNDSNETADALIKLLKPVFCLVNLIPINKTENSLLAPSKSRVETFKNRLEKGGLTVTIRRKAGEDVAAACGQLRRSYLSEQGLLSQKECQDLK